MRSVKKQKGFWWVPLAAAAVSALSASQTNKQQKAIAERQMQFQHDETSTAHQREVTDLRAAGLNPILSGTGGGGAASGAGASWSPINVGESAVSSAMNASRNIADVQNIRQDTKLKSAQEDNNFNDARLKSQLYNTEYDKQKLLAQQAETEKHNTNAAKQTAEILTANAKGAALEGEIDQTKYGEVMRYINRAVQSLTGGASAYRNLKK